MQPPGNGSDPGTAGFRFRDARQAIPAPVDGGPTHWSVRELSKPGARDYVVAPIRLPGPSYGVVFGDLLPRSFGPLPQIDARSIGTDHDGLVFYAWDERGWPWPGLASEWPWFRQSAWPTPPVDYGFAIGAPSSPASDFWPYGVNELAALPLRPCWPGLLADTAFYALVWLIPGALRAARRRRRTLRGRCGACGHALAADQGRCPECGASPLGASG